MHPALGNWARGYLWGKGNDPTPHWAPSWNHPHTHVLPTHGFKHFLKLDTELLDVVHQDAGLEEWDAQEGSATINMAGTAAHSPRTLPPCTGRHEDRDGMEATLAV